LVEPQHERMARARGLLRFGRDRGGATALEFGLTGVAFCGLLLFVIALGFRLYVQVALDFASSRAARLLAVDSKQDRSAKPSTFQSVTFCPLLSAFLSCDNVTVSLQPVLDYRNASSIGAMDPPPFDPGSGGSLMLLRVSYQLPLLSWPIPIAGGGSDTFGAMVTVAYPYQNEY
jgi:Flp pilus assembly protein TadG